MNRPLIVFFAASFFLAAPQHARADYPDRTVRVIVPVAAGGGVDVMARLVSQKLSEKFGQQFVVENRVGAAGIVGTKALIGMPADGYNLLFTPSSLSATIATSKKAPYDLEKDLTPICEVSITPYVMAVHTSVPAKTLAEFVAYAKANPGKLNYSSPGTGSASHLAMEMLKYKAGIDMQHIPGKGMNPALIDLIGGQVQAMFTSVTALQAEGSERVRALALGEKQASGSLPNVPTLDKSGYPGFEISNWNGMLAPAGLDPAIVEKLHDAIVETMKTPDMQKKAQDLGFDLVLASPKEFQDQLASDVERWSEVVKVANIPTN